MMDCGGCLYSQWFPGDQNVVSDCLSRDFHLDDLQQTQLLVHAVPDQVPLDFDICPLLHTCLRRDIQGILSRLNTDVPLPS